MTNTELQFTRELRSPHGYTAIKTTELAEDGSFWMMRHSSDFAFRVTPKVENFQLGLDQVTNNPQAWNQRTWFSELPEELASLSLAPECGTAGCLAGTIALQHGARPIFDEDGQYHLSRVTVPGLDNEISVSVFAQQQLVTVLESVCVATLDYEYSVDEDDERWESESLIDYLWRSANTLSDLWRIGQFVTHDRLVQPSDAEIEAADAASRAVFARY